MGTAQQEKTAADRLEAWRTDPDWPSRSSEVWWRDSYQEWFCVLHDYLHGRVERHAKAKDAAIEAALKAVRA